MAETILFFGAGAEISCNMPSGAAFIKGSLLTKRTNLYDALGETILKDLKDLDYAGKHEKHYILWKASVAFREMMLRAFDKINRKGRIEELFNSHVDVGKVLERFESENEKELFLLARTLRKVEGALESAKTSKGYRVVDELESDIKKFFTDATPLSDLVCMIQSEEKKDAGKELLQAFEGRIATEVKGIYGRIVSEKDTIPVHRESDEQKVLRVAQYLTYYGTIKENFSSIVHPKDAGVRKFWGLVNFYWSAYFSILLPLHNQMNEKQRAEAKPETANPPPYREFLKNLKPLVEEVYDEGNYPSPAGGSEYYEVLREKKKEYDVAGRIRVITTNYTPYLEFLFGIEQVAFFCREYEAV